MAKKRKKNKSRRTQKVNFSVKNSNQQKSLSYNDWKPNTPIWLKEIQTSIDQGDIQVAKKLLAEEELQKKLAGLSNIYDIYFSKYEIALQLVRTFQGQRALQYCFDALKLGESVDIYNGIGLIYDRLGKCSLAIENLYKAKRLEPNNIAIWNNLGCCFMKVGRAQEAIDLFRKAIAINPKYQDAYSNLLLNLNYLPEVEVAEIFEESKKMAQIQMPPALTCKKYNNFPDPDKKLRIGYISPDFKVHSVMYFFESLLMGHDRNNFEIYGYGDVTNPDEHTGKLIEKFDFYRNITSVDNIDAVKLIKSDSIDILVDLSGHTGRNRLGVLAYKPAPIQVTYLGYPNTTGISQVDYRFTDAVADTPDQQQYYTEKLVFLPNGFLCYNPGDIQPPIKNLSSLKRGYTLFGCFNTPKKINHIIVKIWIDVLKNVPNSKLLLKFKDGDDEQIKEYLWNLFAEHGLKDPKKDVMIFGAIPYEAHLDTYNSIDIALDTYPYNGTTTTCQALFMGVPVITLTGKNHASRVGLDILSRLDMQFFSAQSPEEYVKKAVALASKPEALAKIRTFMRQRLAASPLCNYKLITNDIENAYRKMWHQWCQSQKDFRPTDYATCDKTAEIAADGLNFTNIKTTKVGDISVGFNDKYVIKIEHGKHPWKLRTFSEEIEIIKLLNSRGCVSCPRLMSEGKLKNGERYFIQERFNNRRAFNTADIMFSILEQKSFGVCQGDFKRDNFILDNDSICHIIDYDQAIYDERFIDMGNLQYLEWFNQFFVNRWKKLGLNLGNIYNFGGFQKEEVLSMFKNNSFNLAETSIFKEQITTNTKSGIYHSLNTSQIYINGARDLSSRLDALSNIKFEKDEKVLDVGCNMGLLGHYLHDRGCKVTGVDMDKKIVTGAKMVANILNKDIQFKHLDLDTARIEEEYDTICLFSVIHHVANFQQATENIAQKCNRVILECSLQEHGAKPVQGRWMQSSGWEFNCSSELINYLETAFKGFKFQKYHGNVDRQRAIMTFVKEPQMAASKICN
ncbi:MAG: methyltransferase domain-containing protein [Phycisphaerae bacterium]|nr:methyltransferase domain-containing protein [Phycisphaerae bacterium]